VSRGEVEQWSLAVCFGLVKSEYLFDRGKASRDILAVGNYAHARFRRVLELLNRRLPKIVSLRRLTIKDRAWRPIGDGLKHRKRCVELELRGAADYACYVSTQGLRIKDDRKSTE
jgi:hypothetical protein